MVLGGIWLFLFPSPTSETTPITTGKQCFPALPIATVKSDNLIQSFQGTAGDTVRLANGSG